MNKKTFTDMLVIGFAIFATYFGAGNLIFPTSLGFNVGSGWNLAIIGFFLSGIFLPMLAIVSVGKNGSIDHIADNVHPIFSKLLIGLVMIVILGLVGLPRIGAVTYELAIQPILPSVSNILVSVIFFGITIYLSINPTTVVDIIGKWLTPILLIILAIILFTGIISPLGSPIDTGIENSFTTGFYTGYEIGDALAGLVIATIFISAIKAKGYSNPKELSKMTMLCGVVAGLGLLLVYGGLLYLGATGSGVLSAELAKAGLLAALVQNLLGKTGLLFLGGAVIFACLTTSLGISTAVGDFINRISNNKISHKTSVIALNIVAGILSITGVTNIMKVAIPILLICYPVVIVIIFLGLFSGFIPNKGVYRGSVYLTLAVAILDTFGKYGAQSIGSFISYLPLANKGFPWIIPAIVGLIIGMLVFPKTTTKEDIMTE